MFGARAQVVYRITDSLATHYCVLHPETFASQEQCMQLFYVIIMINTELHNVNLKTRRTAAQLIALVYKQST